MRKNISKLAAFMIFLTFALSCSTGSRIQRAEREAKANIRQLTKEEKNEKDTVVLPKHITYIDDSGKEQTIMTAEKDSVTGEVISTVRLPEVVVRSKAKTVPERNGKINLDFIIDVPEDLLNKDWKLTFVPILNNAGELSRLDSVIITGNEWRFLDERKKFHRTRRLKNKAQWATRLSGRVGGVFTEEYRDSVMKAEVAKYEYFTDSVNADRGGIRLDTVIRGSNGFQYHYSHVFPTNDMATKLKMSFEGYIDNLDYQRFRMAEGDTLNYFISSMMQFLDRSPRYKRKIIHRRVTESLSADIQFLVGRTEVLDTLADNAAEINRISMKMDEINRGNEFVIDSIVMTASCSPEGSVAANAVLAKNRAESLKQRLMAVISTNAEAENLLSVQSVPEDWNKVEQYIKQSKDIRHANDILNIIETTANPDERELRIKTEYPEDYKVLFTDIYPKVRHVDFQFYLARRNMVEDVMFTDVIDEDYADAIALMDRRKYKEAMEKLTEYEDWNAAICYMSLGYNQRAYEIFGKQPETADREYLMSILLSRLGKTQQAVDMFLKSCRMDYSKIDRGQLDPEISQLIKQYKLDEIVGW